MTVARFWREQKNRYNLLGSKCGNCGQIFFPPEEICKDCHRKSLGKMESTMLNGKGKIISYTIVHEGADSFRSQIPYILAIIEMDEGPRLTAQIVDVPYPDDGNEDNNQENNSINSKKSNKEPFKKLTIGSPVRSVFRKISEDGKSGTIHYGYKFKLE